MAPLVQPDFSEVPPPLEDGEYTCQILGSEAKQGQKAPYTLWKLNVYPSGQKILHSTPMAGKAAGMFKHMIHVAGDKMYDQGAYDTDQLNGKYIRARIATELYNGQPQLKVKGVFEALPDEIEAAKQSGSDIPW